MFVTFILKLRQSEIFRMTVTFVIVITSCYRSYTIISLKIMLKAIQDTVSTHFHDWKTEKQTWKPLYLSIILVTQKRCPKALDVKQCVSHIVPACTATVSERTGVGSSDSTEKSESL